MRAIDLSVDAAELARYYARFDSEHLSRSLKDIVANDLLVGKFIHMN